MDGFVATVACQPPQWAFVASFVPLWLVVPSGREKRKAEDGHWAVSHEERQRKVLQKPSVRDGPRKGNNILMSGKQQRRNR